MSEIQSLGCPVCGGASSLLDVVDFNKSCEEAKGKYLALSGIPVYYALCGTCGFCFAPELMTWGVREFEERIYNAEYVLVDPDYVERRPGIYAGNLQRMFGARGRSLSHLDYGGGNGLLAKILREDGWKSNSYDPMIDKETRLEQLGKFDLISAIEVFEHVPDVNQLVLNLKSLLAPEGLVIFSTQLSDGEILPSRRINWWYAAPRNGHISLFSRKSLGTLAEKHQLKCGSFTTGIHMFYTQIPTWAADIFKVK